MRRGDRATRQARRERLRQLGRKRDEHKARVRARRKAKKRWRPSRWWLVVIALILLLLLLRPCRCTPLADEVPGAKVVEPAEPEPTDAPAALPKVMPSRIPRSSRPTLPPPSVVAPSWLDVFRMQVSARSPRLAACFEGADRPGTLKWSTSIEPTQGAVSEHTVEPMLDTLELNNDERSCIIEVLENPGYNLPTQGAPATPRRVGLVIEF